MGAGGKTPWYAEAPLIREPDGFRSHGIWISAFSLSSPEGVRWPAYSPFRERLITLLEEYGAICAMAGAVFPIVSGWRTREWQHAFYYREHNCHTQGYALDIAPVHDWTVARMAMIAGQRRRMPESRLQGIGATPKWLHIDVRPRRKRTDWKNTTHEFAD